MACEMAMVTFVVSWTKAKKSIPTTDMPGHSNSMLVPPDASVGLS